MAKKSKEKEAYKGDKRGVVKAADASKQQKAEAKTSKKAEKEIDKLNEESEGNAEALLNEKGEEARRAEEEERAKEEGEDAR